MTDTNNPYFEKTLINGVEHYFKMPQGTEEWNRIRLGRLTASGMKQILTAKNLAFSKSEETKTYLFNLAAQRITGMSEPHFMSYDMARGHVEEGLARDVYEFEKDTVRECGFIINGSIGCSPDGLVGDDGMIECKSRLPKYQVKTIMNHIVNCEGDAIPSEYMLQVQAGLYVAKRYWCDFISYSNGLNMVIIRCEKIAKYQDAIHDAVIEAENQIQKIEQQCREQMSDNPNIIAVEWVDHNEEITV